MRVTERQLVDALLTAIGNLRSGISTVSEQISSGKRVNRPSDDPAAAERISQFRNVLRTTERRLQTVNEGVGRLNLSDSVLDQAGNTFQRAKELAVQMRNDTNTAVERRNAAQEVQQLILGLASIGNTQLNGRFVFAGNETQTEPYVPGTVTGSVSTTNTGSATIAAAVVVVGFKLAYHVNQDIFLEFDYGSSEGGLTSFEVLSGGAPLLSDEERQFEYYLLNIGFNLLPGEAFVSDSSTFNTTFYVIAGIGNTDFAGGEQFTLNFGTGYKILFADAFSLNIDVNDLVFNIDVLGEDKVTHNLRYTVALSWYF